MLGWSWATKSRLGAKTIIHQMQEREKARLREKEIKIQEGIQLLEQASLREKQIDVEKQRKQKSGAVLLAEIVAANQEQTREKARRKQVEIRPGTVRRFVEINAGGYRRRSTDRSVYYREGETRPGARWAIGEVGRIEGDGAAEIGGGARESQWSSSTIKILGVVILIWGVIAGQAEIDALRARRAYEANERKWRAQQTEIAKKQAKIQRELAAARELQRMEKERKMIQQAHIEHEQFQKMVNILQEQVLKV